MKILIVEDDFLIASHVADLLREAGHEVLDPCSTSCRALQLLAGTRPDLAILDIAVGRETTAAVAHALRARTVPFVVYSGYDPRYQCGDLAGAPHVYKPLDTDLLRKVEEIAR